MTHFNRTMRQFVVQTATGILLAGLMVSAAVQAWQETTTVSAGPDPATELPAEPGVPPEVAEWPGIESLSIALANPVLRDDLMLTLAAMLSLHDTPVSESAEQGLNRAQTFANRREWLVNLNRRFGMAVPRSPVVDPAAWQLQIQLDRVDLPGSRLSTPLGPGLDVTLNRVFNRSQPTLAAASLPDLLWHLEAEATLAWAELQPGLNNDPWFTAALMEQSAGWFAWTVDPASGSEDNALPPDNQTSRSELASGRTESQDEPAGFTAQDRLLARHRASLGALLETAAGVGPPDLSRLQVTRQELLAAMPTLDFARRAQAVSLVHMAGLIDGLYEHRFLNFTEGLLAISAQLEIDAPVNELQTQRFAAWLAEVLPAFSASYGRALSAVDPRLNSVIATTYDAVRTLAQPVTREQRKQLRSQIGDAVARLALLVPDLGYYFALPVRDPIAGAVDACTGIAGELDPDGTPAMTRELFDDCQKTLVDMADNEARQAQLAGDPDGPFAPLQLRRELDLTAGQRINYGIGYLHDRYATGCAMPERDLPNPLEWSYLATVMVWLAEQSPVFFQTPENEQLLERMQAIGRELVSNVGEQVDCMAGAGAVINDPVDRITNDYRENLNRIGQRIEDARLEYRAVALKAGADVRLDEDARQRTTYRPSDLIIEPCDLERACEMTGQLSVTRALSGLFDEPYLIADQSGLGDLRICYDNMEWVDRRFELVREDDENVANYYGRLGFDLRGQFTDETGVTDLFGFRFTSPDEHHYMFAAANEEALADSCPVEWIGQRIVTPLPEQSPRIVPDRLTYLSAARTLPSRLLTTHWESGAEWRDWFVTGIGVQRQVLDDPQDITARLNQHLASMYRAEQNAVYGSLMSPVSGPFTNALSQDIELLETSKQLLRSQMMLFFPHILTHSDPLREAVAGNGGLLDQRLISRFRQQDVPADEMLLEGFERLSGFQTRWRELPESVRRNGSIADSVAHALIRLDSVYSEFFAEEPVSGGSLLLTPPGSAAGQTEQEQNTQQ